MMDDDAMKHLREHVNAAVTKRMTFISANREKMIESWVAETGLLPSESVMVEQLMGDGSVTVRIERKSPGTIATPEVATDVGNRVWPCGFLVGGEPCVWPAAHAGEHMAWVPEPPTFTLEQIRAAFTHHFEHGEDVGRYPQSTESAWNEVLEALTGKAIQRCPSLFADGVTQCDRPAAHAGDHTGMVAESWAGEFEPKL
jgi:hypothetical protein